MTVCSNTQHSLNRISHYSNKDKQQFRHRIHVCFGKPISRYFGCSPMVVDCGSKTGISLRPRGVVGKFIPSLALSVQNIYVVLFQPSLEVIASLEEGHAQTSRDMPCDVAVHSGNNKSATILLKQMARAGEHTARRRGYLS